MDVFSSPENANASAAYSPFDGSPLAGMTGSEQQGSLPVPKNVEEGHFASVSPFAFDHGDVNAALSQGAQAKSPSTSNVHTAPTSPLQPHVSSPVKAEGAKSSSPVTTKAKTKASKQTGSASTNVTSEEASEWFQSYQGIWSIILIILFIILMVMILVSANYSGGAKFGLILVTLVLLVITLVAVNLQEPYTDLRVIQEERQQEQQQNTSS